MKKSIREFIESLPKTGWIMTGDGGIRRKCRVKGGLDKQNFCPILIVAIKKKIPVCFMGDYRDADYQYYAPWLGLTVEEADQIAAAADDPFPIGGTALVRKKILSITGLKERGEE